MRDRWDLTRISCLIAEDNPHMRSILRSVLAGFGIRSAYEATDGAEALEMVVDRKPDIVLCDWMMNPFGGNEFLRILRADRDLVISTTPVLIVTAHAKRATILEGIEIGIHGFVAKPIAPAILYRHIGEILERQDMYGRSKGILGPGQQPPLRKLDATGSDPVAPPAPSAEVDGLALL
ncbi:response regulator [Stappia sp. BW2]|uniref:response regulator n=1 Tax=Stappia sp. BW2 TaxID=2592622 RepID=UPI0011DE6EE3|nr:response regulator [Stappia sp. BW2]TYC66879.1 response regulator [Stappia sp. BW2]